MKTICIVTGTRAEYGLFRPLLNKLLMDGAFAVRLVVTGMHLCPEFGLTYGEIEADGLQIDEKIEILLSSDTNVGMTKSTGLAMLSFAEYFQRKRPDLLIVLGDRFEIFACATAAALTQIPIAHLYGGDTTEGAVDEFMRHSITKMSYLHFTSNDLSRNRVIQMGEEPGRVFNVGALAIDNILHRPLLSKEALEKNIEFALDRPYALVTFHPVTLENGSAQQQFEELLCAIDQFPDMKFIFTKANSDADGRVINARLDQYLESKPNCIGFTSLGLLRYLSAMSYACMVIGNSSSGLYETPSFHIPTINIGDRQRGRLQPASVINCEPNTEAIVSAIRKGLTPGYLQVCAMTSNPYGDGNAAEKIVAVIKDALSSGKIDIKKKFYDIGV